MMPLAFMFSVIFNLIQGSELQLANEIRITCQAGDKERANTDVACRQGRAVEFGRPLGISGTQNVWQMDGVDYGSGV